jgi:cytochrome P450
MSVGEPERTLDEQLAAIVQSRPQGLADPFPVWERMLAEDPVHVHGPLVLVGSHRHVKALIRDYGRLSNSTMEAGTRARAIIDSLTDEQRQAHREVSAFESLYLSRSDGDQHRRLRTVAHATFTPRRIAAMQSAVERYTTELIAASLQSGEVVDLMPTLAYQLPLMVIADMLGVAPGMRESIHDWSNRLARNRGGDDPIALMDAHAAMAEFRHYVEDEIIPERRASPGTDLVTDLMQAHEGEQLHDQELTAMFVILLFAGHETTTNLIGNGLVELMRHRDQWDLLCDDPGLIPNAVEELLRWVTPVQWLGRVATESFALDGVTIEQGQTVFPVLAAANRDPDAFAAPGRLDVTRADVRNHLALGFGPHFCIGNALARLEGQVAFRTLVSQFPGLHLAEDELTWRGNAMLRGLASLRVRLGEPADVRPAGP